MSTLTLPDGRGLEYTLAGAEAGPALLHHHGTPGAVVPLRSVDRAARKHGLRLLCFSRAGYGRSDRQAGRTVGDAAADAAALLDHLDIETCVTSGWSGGGPHALATAALLPGRVRGVAVLASVAPYDAPGLDFLAGMGEANLEEFALTLEGEHALRPWLEREADDMRNVDAASVLESLDTLLSEVDRACVTEEFGEDLAVQLREGLARGVDGQLDDDIAFVRPWGFSVEDLAVPAYVWQGDADLMVPFAHGQWLAGHVPGAVAHLLPGHGHISIVIDQADTILGELAACP